MVNKKFWKNKKVLITGHTGFKEAGYQFGLRCWVQKYLDIQLILFQKRIFLVQLD